MTVSTQYVMAMDSQGNTYVRPEKAMIERQIVASFMVTVVSVGIRVKIR